MNSKLLGIIVLVLSVPVFIIAFAATYSILLSQMGDVWMVLTGIGISEGIGAIAAGITVFVGVLILVGSALTHKRRR